MMPLIDDMKVDYQNKIQIVKENVDASQDLVKQVKLAGVPYLAMYYMGELI